MVAIVQNFATFDITQHCSKFHPVLRDIKVAKFCTIATILLAMINQQILGLEISVSNIVFVQIKHGLDYISTIISQNKANELSL
jgi:hypothetical protein